MGRTIFERLKEAAVGCTIGGLAGTAFYGAGKAFTSVGRHFPKTWPCSRKIPIGRRA